jgi:polynucleotide 5'-kinase involved in rRNA processing
VDTGGLVQGALGLALKRAKARAVDPDLVVVLQRRDESEPIAGALGGAGRPVVLRLTPAPAVARRSAERRRAHREGALRDYFARARPVTLGLARVPLTDRRGTGVAAPPEGLLLGVLDAGGETLGIARVRAADTAEGWLVVETPVEAGRIAALRLGRATWRPA